MAAGRQQGKGIAAVLSPWMTVEEAYLLASYLKSLSPNVSLALGPVRIVGEDDKYPKDVHGQPVEPVKFTIRAEKCPNRRGVEAVLRHFAGDVAADGRRAGPCGGRRDRGRVSGRRRSGGLDYRRSRPRRWKTFATVIVQDILPSPASERATFVLPGGSFAERDGTFVNHAGLARRSSGRSARPAKRSRTAESCGTLPAGAGCSTRAHCGRKWPRRFHELAATRCRRQLGEHGVRLVESKSSSSLDESDRGQMHE